MHSGWNGDGIILKPFKKYIKVKHETEFVIGESFLCDEFFHLTGEKDEKGRLRFDMVLNTKEGRFEQSRYDKSTTLNLKSITFIEFID